MNKTTLNPVVKIKKQTKLNMEDLKSNSSSDEK